MAPMGFEPHMDYVLHSSTVGAYLPGKRATSKRLNSTSGTSLDNYPRPRSKHQ